MPRRAQYLLTILFPLARHVVFRMAYSWLRRNCILCRLGSCLGGLVLSGLSSPRVIEDPIEGGSLSKRCTAVDLKLPSRFRFPFSTPRIFALLVGIRCIYFRVKIKFSCYLQQLSHFDTTCSHVLIVFHVTAVDFPDPCHSSSLPFPYGSPEYPFTVSWPPAITYTCPDIDLDDGSRTFF
jgi:hypothetical protein